MSGHELGKKAECSFCRTQKHIVWNNWGAATQSYLYADRSMGACARCRREAVRWERRERQKEDRQELIQEMGRELTPLEVRLVASTENLRRHCIETEEREEEFDQRIRSIQQSLHFFELVVIVCIAVALYRAC